MAGATPAPMDKYMDKEYIERMGVQGEREGKHGFDLRTELATLATTISKMLVVPPAKC